jgi:hypothetical protein
MSTGGYVHKKGSTKEYAAQLSREADCVSEVGMCTWMKELENTQTKRVAYVQTVTGVSKRIVVPFWVMHDKQVFKAYADVVTGTVYTEDGKCLSSTKMSIVKWGKSIGAKTRTKKNEPSAEEIIKLQRNWASGRLS